MSVIGLGVYALITGNLTPAMIEHGGVVDAWKLAIGGVLPTTAGLLFIYLHIKWEIWKILI
jgi:hypothetical protein